VCPKNKADSGNAHTRALLVKTASELIQSGEIPTVTAVAEAAQVSRRTAYRYFP
jgi:AcrR family transcriptional regulator